MQGLTASSGLVALQLSFCANQTCGRQCFRQRAGQASWHCWLVIMRWWHWQQAQALSCFGNILGQCNCVALVARPSRLLRAVGLSYFPCWRFCHSCNARAWPCKCRPFVAGHRTGRAWFARRRQTGQLMRLPGTWLELELQTTGVLLAMARACCLLTHTAWPVVLHPWP
jgi:hypothetical protein